MRFFYLALIALIAAGCAENEFGGANGITGKKSKPRGPQQGNATPVVPAGQSAGGGIAADPGVVNCEEPDPAQAAATFQTPLVSGPHRVGNMGRDATPLSDRNALREYFNELCLATYDPSVGGPSWTNPMMSADKPTRDMACRSYGYARASDDDQYGYFNLSSPKNDWASTWNPSTNQLEVNLDASRAPTSNRILIWTSCVGKLPDTCAERFKQQLTCQSP